MRVFCICTEQNSTSRRQADRCVESAKPFGIDVERFPSVSWTHIRPTATLLDLDLRLEPHYSRSTTETHCPAFRIANGLTHYQLYQDCSTGVAPICIVEHDAVFVGPLPETPTCGVMQISSHRDGQADDEWYRNGMSSGRHVGWECRTPDFTRPGIITHPYTKTVGTSGYIITPLAADRMVDHIQKHGVAFADCIHRDIVGPMWMAIPQPVEMHKDGPIAYY